MTSETHPIEEELFVFLSSAPLLETPLPNAEETPAAKLEDIVIPKPEEKTTLTVPISLPLLKEKLNKLSESDLNTLVLEDVISSFHSALQGPWESITDSTGAVLMVGAYVLTCPKLTQEFLGYINSDLGSGFISSTSVSVSEESTEYTVTITLDASNSKAATYAAELNVCYNSMVSYHNEETLESPAEETLEQSDGMEQDDINMVRVQQTHPSYPIADQVLADSQAVTSLTFAPMAMEVTESESTQKQVIKLGVAILGSWKHPIYGEVTFTQQDFDEMLSNFKNNSVGFEPPLFLGHASQSVQSAGGITYSTVEGAPAEGFLLSLYQEGNCLYSEWEVTNPSVYDAVASNRYRYNSGEFVRNYLSKDTGDSIGTTLIGMALTNRPFVPNLPRVKALSEPNKDDMFLFTMGSTDEVKTIDEIKMDIEKTTVPEAEKLSELQAELATRSQQLASVEQAYKLQLSDAQATIESLTTRLNEATEAARQKEVDAKLKDLESLALPLEVKETYSEMIKTGALGAAEGTVLASLRKTAELTVLTTQQGSVNETSALNDPQVNPYQSTIERNHATATARQSL